jgi:hypothetical protein
MQAQYRTLGDYPELLAKTFNVEITQVITGWEKDNVVEEILEASGEVTVAHLVEWCMLDKLGAKSHFSIKNNVVEVGLVFTTDSEKGLCYPNLYSHFEIKVKTLGDVLTLDQIFETIGVKE